MKWARNFGSLPPVCEQMDLCTPPSPAAPAAAADAPWEEELAAALELGNAGGVDEDAEDLDTD